MKLLTRTIITSAILACIWFIPYNIYAYTSKEWNLPWIKIIKRSQWVTDESLIYKNTTTNNVDSNDTDETVTTTPTKSQVASNYLSTVFPEQVLLDGIITKINNKTLAWSRGYKTQKSHIIVHHTVNDLTTIKTPEQARAIANSIFRYHTVTNKRWDIGYNFIIDPWWNIYEGRWGGESVVGAHAKYNNAASLWIALMGNFEINEPTKEQLAALTKLSTALMIKYNINPDSEIYSHIDDSAEPYIKDVVTDAFIGHRDTGKTACPGKNLYSQLPAIQQAIRSNLVVEKKLSPAKKVNKVTFIKKPYTLTQDSTTLTFPLSLPSSIQSCTTKQPNLSISCKRIDNTQISVTIKKTDPTKLASWLTSIIITQTWWWIQKLALTLNRSSDQRILMEQTKKTYITKHNITFPKTESNKFQAKISLSDIKKYTKQNVNVLLYEASTTLSERKFLCQQCTVVDDKGIRMNDNSFTIINNGTSLTYSSKTTNKSIKSISITPNKADGTTFITNYNRTSYAGIAWNNFYGTITISQQPIKLLDTEDIRNQYVVTNTLPFDLYLRGIVESNDTEPKEKAKTMALLAKNYILFYLHPQHRHPSIPEKANYIAVDDARIFQKYVGAGVDMTLKNRKQVLSETNNQVITYNNNLAFLPYFSCSAGFTRSAKEKYWWKDTPYLVTVYDPNPCKDFNGHGVWLAGNGATYLANNWSSYEDIITYFYPWTRISTY